MRNVKLDVGAKAAELARVALGGKRLKQDASPRVVIEQEPAARLDPAARADRYNKAGRRSLTGKQQRRIARKAQVPAERRAAFAESIRPARQEPPDAPAAPVPEHAPRTPQPAAQRRQAPPASARPGHRNRRRKRAG